MEIIAARVRSLRDYKDWSQEDLARESGLQRPHISLIENSERIPGADSLVKLATALETSTDYLLGRTDSPAAYPTTVNHPALKDPLFQDFLVLWPRLDDEGRKVLLQITEAMAAKVERRGE